MPRSPHETTAPSPAHPVTHAIDALAIVYRAGRKQRRSDESSRERRLLWRKHTSVVHCTVQSLRNFGRETATTTAATTTMSVVVRESSLSGKGLFGTERFAKGAVIVTETPLAVGAVDPTGDHPLYTPVWVLLDALARAGHLPSLEQLQPMPLSALSWEAKDDVAVRHVAAAHGLRPDYVSRMYAVVASINLRCPDGRMGVYPMLSYLRLRAQLPHPLRGDHRQALRCEGRGDGGRADHQLRQPLGGRCAMRRRRHGAAPGAGVVRL